jgi:hypothetical protein
MGMQARLVQLKSSPPGKSIFISLHKEEEIPIKLVSHLLYLLIRKIPSHGRKRRDFSYGRLDVSVWKGRAAWRPHRLFFLMTT